MSHASLVSVGRLSEMQPLVHCFDIIMFLVAFTAVWIQWKVYGRQSAESLNLNFADFTL